LYTKVNCDLAQINLHPSSYPDNTVGSHSQPRLPDAASSAYLFDQAFHPPNGQNLLPQIFDPFSPNNTSMAQGPSYQWKPAPNSMLTKTDEIASSLFIENNVNAKLGRKKTVKPRTFRQRKFQQHQSLSRSTSRPSVQASSKTSTPVTSVPAIFRNNQTLDTARTRGKIEKEKDSNIDPERALNLLRKAIETQPYSPVSVNEMAALLKKMEDVVLREKLYGSSSSDSGELPVPSTSSDSIDSMSNSEVIEPEYPTDASSVSSTPRLVTDDKQETEPAESQTSHKSNCPHCGNKPNYCCSKPDCGYFTHTRGDAKRHEEGDKHYPQARFMCCECPLAQAEIDGNGNPVCNFCETSCMDLDLLRAHYLNCSEAKEEGRTFSRKDHLIQHLRDDHSIVDDIAQHVARSKYAVICNWPRRCHRCPATFQTWEERMRHLAAHAEEDFHPRKFGKKPKDDDDEDDQDDHHGSGAGSKGKGLGYMMLNTSLPTQPYQPSQSNREPQSNQGNYRNRTQNVLPNSPGINLLGLSTTPRKPSVALERYLNEPESTVPIPAEPLKSSRKPSCHESTETSVASRNSRPLQAEIDIPVKYTPVTGRVSREKEGAPVHMCDICGPEKVRREARILFFLLLTIPQDFYTSRAS
jgi:hypothetical protein